MQKLNGFALQGMKHKSQEGQTQDHAFFSSSSSVFLDLALKSDPGPFTATMQCGRVKRPLLPKAGGWSTGRGLHAGCVGSAVDSEHVPPSHGRNHRPQWSVLFWSAGLTLALT